MTPGRHAAFRPTPVAPPLPLRGAALAPGRPLGQTGSGRLGSVRPGSSSPLADGGDALGSLTDWGGPLGSVGQRERLARPVDRGGAAQHPGRREGLARPVGRGGGPAHRSMGGARSVRRPRRAVQHRQVPQTRPAGGTAPADRSIRPGGTASQLARSRRATQHGRAARNRRAAQPRRTDRTGPTARLRGASEPSGGTARLGGTDPWWALPRGGAAWHQLGWVRLRKGCSDVAGVSPWDPRG